MTIINGASFSFPIFFPQPQSTYLEVEVVMVVINNSLELFSIPKMMDSYLSTCNKNTFHAYRLFIVGGHDESIATFIDINPVPLFTWNMNIKILKWRYVVSCWYKKASVWSSSFNEWLSVSLTSDPFERKIFLERDSERWFVSGFTYMDVHTLIKLLNLIFIQILPGLPGALILPAKCVWSKAAKILILYPGSGDFSRP